MRGTARGGSRWTGSENDVAPSAMTLPSPATFDRLPGDLLGSLWARTSAILAGKHFKAAALLSPPLCFLLRETEVLSREVSSAVNAACTAMCAMYYVQGSKSRAPIHHKLPHPARCNPKLLLSQRSLCVRPLALAHYKRGYPSLWTASCSLR